MRRHVLRVVLAILCAYHLGIGLVSCLWSEGAIRFSAFFYGTEVEGGPAFVYMLKALGMYAIFTGILLGFALADPERFRPVIFAAALLLAMRAATRLIFFDTLHAAFGVTAGRNLLNVGLLALQAALLVFGARPAPPSARG